MIHKLYKAKNGWIHTSQNYIPTDPINCLVFHSLQEFSEHFAPTSFQGVLRQIGTEVVHYPRVSANRKKRKTLTKQE
jgi:hypothetical protein